MALMIVEVGRPGVAELARARFPEESDVEVVSEVGHLDVAEVAEDLARRTYAGLVKLRSRGDGPIKVVLSGPLAVAFMVGMMVGINHFNLTLLHYAADRDRYVALPTPNHGWMSGPAQRG